jgi:hypothetical protein
MENSNQTTTHVEKVNTLMPNICDKIKITCQHVYNNSNFVKINEEKINDFIKQKSDLFSSVPSWASCHFNPNDFDFESTLGFVFVVDALNFCFWPYERILNKSKEDFEYGDLVNNTLHTLKTDPNFFTAERLINLTQEELCKNIFSNEKEFPLLDERTRSLRELGTFIKNKHESKFANFLKSCGNDCVKIVEGIVAGVSTFRDETIYKGKQIFIYKRAQILSADLYYMCSELHKPIYLSNADALTMFADYRVPQVLLDLGIMEYESNLENKILNKEEVQPNSHEEIELRACTIISVEMIKNAINKQFGKKILSLEVDYILWNVGEERRKELKPHHRTLTIFY